MSRHFPNPPIDASDKRLIAWLAELPPRQELIVRMALNGRSKNQGPRWDGRVAELTNELKIHTTARMAKLLTEVREQGRVIDAWAAGDARRSAHSGTVRRTMTILLLSAQHRK